MAILQNLTKLVKEKRWEVNQGANAEEETKTASAGQSHARFQLFLSNLLSMVKTPYFWVTMGALVFFLSFHAVVKLRYGL